MSTLKCYIKEYFNNEKYFYLDISMRRIVGFLYSVLPKKIIDKLGKSAALKGVRDVLLRNNNNLILSEKKLNGEGSILF